MKQYELHMNYT